jgi:hypothetical protein
MNRSGTGSSSAGSSTNTSRLGRSPGQRLWPNSGTPHHLQRILREYEIHHNLHRPHRSLHGAAPLKPLPEPVDLAQYRVRRQARVGGLINEYRLAT